MAEISVTLTEEPDKWSANVTVTEGSSSSEHTVEMDKTYYEKLSGGAYTPEQVIETSFEFLLAREPKESILGRFELPVINRYFGNYETELPRLLEKQYGE